MALPMSPESFNFPVMNAVVGFNLPERGKQKWKTHGHLEIMNTEKKKEYEKFKHHCCVTEEIQYHGGLRSRELGQAPILLCAPLTRVNRWSDCIDYRIEIVRQIGTLSTIPLHFTHNESQWPTVARQYHFVKWLLN